MRRTIASRLTESTQTVPSYTVNMECRLDALMKLRGEINAGAPDKDGKPAFKLSVNDFIIKALALALRDVPMANASWTSSARLMHKHSDVGVAVAIDDGLITPIVRKAEQKTLTAISAEVKDLAGRARHKKLKPAEYQGGTTSVSNLGMFGVTDFTSIINPPQASIVSIGAGRKQPVVDANGALAVGTVMNATFAFDHRVIDGALGAELAVAFRGYIENPMTMLV
jgi:pyruvate dehydrogenase E2 component (dihydrolipoamide acetyltransferase)